MPISETLKSANINHQIAFVRYSNGQAKSIEPFLLEIVEYLESRLAKEGASIATKKRLNELMKDVNKRLDRIYSSWERKELSKSLTDAVQLELNFQESSISRVVVDYESVIPSEAQVLSAARNNPLLIASRGGAVDFATFTKGWKAEEIARVSSRISGGFYAGETTQEISRAVIGLKSRNYADGIVNMSNKNIQTMVRTSLNHMATQAKEEFNKANSDLIIGEQWVSTLDSRTTEICMARDGEVFYYKDGMNFPRPPAHYNCRSVLVPVLSEEFDFLDKDATRASKGAEGGEPVDAKLTYYEWLKTQPAQFQNEAIGQTKGKILRNSGISPNEFKKVATNNLGRPLTIQQMRDKDKKIDEYLSSKGM